MSYKSSLNNFIGKAAKYIVAAYPAKSNSSKNALISYLSYPLVLPDRFKEDTYFSNRGIALNIVYALNDLDYNVDVIDFRNVSFSPKKKYDLFIGHGGINYCRLADRLGDNCRKIYLSTGPYWKYLNEQETKRIDSFNRKNNLNLPYERLVCKEEEAAFNIANAIICLGNKNVLTTYSHKNNCYNLNNGHFAHNNHYKISRNYNSVRNNYLFFSGPGNVHKGLDLLLDVFSETRDKHLYICQEIAGPFSDFISKYRQIPNIHLMGVVEMRSSRFHDIARNCGFVIMPTCAEGQPGSVIECMSYGLIPVLTEQANIDLDNIGFLIKELSTNGITGTLSEIDSYPIQSLKILSERTISTINEEYSASKFRSTFSDIICRILNHSPAS